MQGGKALGMVHTSLAEMGFVLPTDWQRKGMPARYTQGYHSVDRERKEGIQVEMAVLRVLVSSYRPMTR